MSTMTADFFGTTGLKTGAVRLTRRGRLVLTTVFLTIALVAMVVAAGFATASREGGAPESVRVVEVQPGDTLYALASDIAEPGEIREMVRHIQELNSLSGVALEPGQKLAIPR